MHKKIESELVSLAHSILQLKNKDDVLVLKEKAREIYEKLSVLAFVDRLIEATPAVSKDEILERVETFGNIIEGKNLTNELQEVSTEEIKEVAVEIIKEEKTEEVVFEKQELVAEKETIVIEEKEVEAIPEELDVKEEKTKTQEEDLFSIKKEEKIVLAVTKNTLEKELEGTISLDVSSEIFENAVRIATPRKSLNDVFIGNNLQIGLNDRIAFVKHLFDGSQEDFNRVLSQLNSYKTEKEAIQFVSNMVKLDYDWKGKELYEERFITLITRKFT
ncbi:hypothetical protein [Flavicella sp.]|uniref:hypothetical protein n=1 Tax=Flavicella sp. TaxID=2957742 RepID=UPI00301B0A96